MSYATPEQFAAANKSNLEAVLSLANTVFSGAERFAALNLNTARAALEGAAGSANATLGVKDARDIIALQTTLAQPAIEKLVAYSRSVYEIASQTQGEITKFLENQSAEMTKSIATALDTAAKSAPAGSDVAFNAVKSALAAATSAYDNVSKAAKQVAEMTVANVTAATDATVKASSAASTKLKKVA
jgi:phasin family protein